MFVWLESGLFLVISILALNNKGIEYPRKKTFFVYNSKSFPNPNYFLYIIPNLKVHNLIIKMRDQEHSLLEQPKVCCCCSRHFGTDSNWSESVIRNFGWETSCCKFSEIENPSNQVQRKRGEERFIFSAKWQMSIPWSNHVWNTLTSFCNFTLERGLSNKKQN